MEYHFKKLLIPSFLLASCLALTGALLVPFSNIHAQTANPNQYSSAIGPTPNGTAIGAVNTDVTKAPYTLLTPLPCIGTNISGCSSTSGGTFSSIDLADFIAYAYKFLLALAVVLAVFMITVGGFEYMLSGATGSKTDAVKKIQDAVLGLFLALITYLLLYTIDPNLVSSNNLSIPPISTSAMSSAAAPAPAAPAPTIQGIQNNNNNVLNSTYQQSSPANTVNQASSPINNNCIGSSCYNGNNQSSSNSSGG